jgi:hypothetical protein
MPSVWSEPRGDADCRNIIREKYLPGYQKTEMCEDLGRAPRVCLDTDPVARQSPVRWVSSRVRWLSGVGLSHIYADPLTKQQT